MAISNCINSIVLFLLKIGGEACRLAHADVAL